MAKPNVHVVPRSGQWGVLREGSNRDSSHHPTRAAAIEAARTTAERERVEVLIHGRNGQIRERNSYGNDPFPPRG